jgi:histidyl-tRNA synthetase
MFTFTDQGGRSLTLRPEGTAAICRAYVEHGMQTLAQPVKLWYWGPFFRHERPQAGRFREFNQLGIEAIGSDSPLVDADAIVILDQIYRQLGVPSLRLRLSSLGSPDARADYREELLDFLRKHHDGLSKDVQERFEENPLRAFDSKDEGTIAVMAEAPRLVDQLAGEDAEHFAEVRRLLDMCGVEYEVDGTLVRGLDFYTRTVFEFETDVLEAHSRTIGAGGRYDGLVEALGGPATPGCGWAAGVERIVMALAEEPVELSADAFVVATEGQRERAFALVRELRGAGFRAELDLGGRSVKGQMKQADRVGARAAIVLDEDGSAQLRDMQSGQQRPVEVGRVADELRMT